MRIGFHKICMIIKKLFLCNPKNTRIYSYNCELLILFEPEDEEIGGVYGIAPFLKSEEFKALNMGFALDEGLAHPGNKYSVFYGERCTWCEYVFCALS